MACKCSGCGSACSRSGCCSGSCSGTCQGSCSSCAAGCANTCNNNCSGGCKGDCRGGCSGSCSSACNKTCSGGSQDTNIANLNAIAFDRIIKASDMNTLKAALDHELTRRGQSTSSSTFYVGVAADDAAATALKTDLTKIGITISESAIAGNLIDNAYPIAIKNGVVNKYNEIVGVV